MLDVNPQLSSFMLLLLRKEYLTQIIFNVIVPLLLTILFISDPTNADGDKYYGAFVGNFEDRFHGIKGEVDIIRVYIVLYITNKTFNKI